MSIEWQAHRALGDFAVRAALRATAFAVCVTAPALAFADCHNNFTDGVAPKSLTAPATDHPHLLCFMSYAVLESGGTRTAVWSAESLTRDKVLAAREVTRENTFHAEDTLAHGERAELEDYVRSGWDRGHMTPSGDMPDVQSQAESFSLANMIPQAPRNNRRIWEHIEASTRVLAKSTGGVYVVTGPGYTSAQPKLLNARVRIPELVWKAVYVPGRGAGAYLVRNDAGTDYAVVSIAEITRLTGIDPFPSLDASMRQSAYALPSPSPHQGEGRDHQVAEATLLGRAMDETVTAASTDRPHRVREETRRASSERAQPMPSIDIVAALESAFEEAGRMVRRWIAQALRDALKSTA